MENPHICFWLAASVAVAVTVVTPTGNRDPLGCESTTAIGGTPPLAEGAGNVTGTDPPVDVRACAAGHVRTKAGVGAGWLSALIWFAFAMISSAKLLTVCARSVSVRRPTTASVRKSLVIAYVLFESPAI